MRRTLGLLLFSVLLAGCPAPECEVAADCDDGDACTDDACFDGVCNSSAINVDDGDACTTDSCDPAAGVIHEPVNVDDQDTCTTDSCDPGTGDISHDPIDPDDGDACTVDSCDPLTGISNDPVNADDGDACTADACDPITGDISHDPVNVDDGDACTVDACDPASGDISHTPVDIDDGDACTIDSCDPITGSVSHDPVDVDDQDACTVDACDPGTGDISNTPIDVDDQNACTLDFCLSGVVFNEPVDVDDGVGCTIDACDPVTGNVTNIPDDNACGDVDGATCSIPVCDVVNDCVEVPDDLQCDDGQACTTADLCDPANGDALTGCAFTIDDNVCDDAVGCTDDVCAPFAGCSSTANNGNCQGGELCDPILDCQPVVGALAQAVISEFQAIGAAGNVGEFIELHNNGAVSGDIAGGVLTNGAAQSAVIRAVTDPTGALGEAVILGAGGFAFGVPNPQDPADIPAGASFVYGEPGTTFEIADGGDALSLSNSDGAALDTVDFTANFVTDPSVALQPGDFPGFAGLSTQLDLGSLDATANDSGDSWCTSFRVADTAGVGNQSCAATVVVLNELLYDGAGGDAGQPFLELAGPGGADLSNLRVRGVEGDDGALQAPNFRIGDVQAGARMRVDGLFVIADEDNILVPAQEQDLLTSFDPENGADALQLVLEDGAGTVIALVDALGYGAPAVTVDAAEGFALFEGAPATDVASGISLARDILSDDTNDNAADFVGDPTPSPGAQNQPVVVTVDAITPNNGLASAGAVDVVVTGTDFGVDAQVNLAGTDVPAADCDYSGIPTTILCDVPASGSGVIRGDVTVTNTAESGGSAGTLANGWTYTGVLNESDLGGEADFCNLQFPPAITVTQGESTGLIFGRIFEAGLTDVTQGQPAPGILADLGFGPQGTDPSADASWVFSPAAFNVEAGINNNDDEYSGSFTAPAVAATTVFQYTFRFSLDGGLSFTYCDGNGAGSNGGLTFEAGQLGTLTVNP